MNPYEIVSDINLWWEAVDPNKLTTEVEFDEMTTTEKFKLMKGCGVDTSWGRLTFTNNSNFAANFFDEDCGLNDARDAVSEAFPEAVEFDAVDCIWFYRDQEACDRDFDNADLNMGVVATWKAKETH